ncbi:MAG: lipopolysaccharide biosynthesis regulator YciM [Candidatus Krumholzibacteriia bacterium]
MNDTRAELALWLIGLMVVVVSARVLWKSFFTEEDEPVRDDYLHALELWIEGELSEAADLLHKVVHDNTHAFEPFLYLGNLLRLQGDAQRAAVLHRSLTVRPNLTMAQKVAVGMSLAEDLNDLELWDESGQVLDSILRKATDNTRYWRARFAQRHGQDNRPEAAKTLKHAVKHVPARDHAWFRNAYICYQLDRALNHAIASEANEAKARLKDVRDFPEANARASLVAAIMAAVENDAAKAVTIASEQLLNNPHELSIFLPLLQEVLLSSGQFARTIPILERACQSENAPASMWVDLALLYEKLNERDKATRFLQSKAGRSQFTPNAAAPYLKMLVNETPDTDFAQVWKMLAMPTAPDGWTCTQCNHAAPHIRWFCSECGAFDAYQAGYLAGEVV